MSAPKPSLPRSLPPRIIAQLTISADDNKARAVAAVRQWFEVGFRTVSGLHQAVVEQPMNDIRGPEATVFVPNGVRALIDIEMQSGSALQSRRYTPQAWDEFTATLDQMPRFAGLGLVSARSQVEPYGPWFEMGVTRNDDDETLQLLNYFGEAVLVEDHSREATLLITLRSIADTCNPLYGEIHWAQQFIQTPLETALGLHFDQALPKARQYARGYGWVTILGEELGRRLGGEDALRRTGAFIEVDHLAAGGYWLRATEHMTDYDDAAARRVFDALRSVLLPGHPNLWSMNLPYQLVDEDARTS